MFDFCIQYKDQIAYCELPLMWPWIVQIGLEIHFFSLTFEYGDVTKCDKVQLQELVAT